MQLDEFKQHISQEYIDRYAVASLDLNPVHIDPHWPSPQLYFVPVNPKSSRSTSSRDRSGSVSTLRAFPLTDNRMVAMCLRPPTIASTGAALIERCRLLNYRAIGGGNKTYRDRKSTRLNSSHLGISYAVFC